MKFIGQQFLRMASSAVTSFTGNKLKGKVAVVTGSTYGIGFAIAERLAADGASVMISSRKEENVTNAIQKLKDKGYSAVDGTVCHVGKAPDREQLFKDTQDKFGGVDILISNAAVNPAYGPLFECSEGAWDKIFDVNVKAAFLLTKEVLPYLKKRSGGSIVYVSSVTAYHPMKFTGAYGVSKTALLGLTKLVALDVAEENIRVNCVVPGAINTSFSTVMRQTKEKVDKLLATIPMRRFGEPEEISGIVSFLVSDDASYITGENFAIAGGFQSRL